MRKMILGLLAVLLIGALAVPASGAHGKRSHDVRVGAKSAYSLKHFFGHSILFRHFMIDTADIKTQDGEGVAAENGARVLRTRHGVRLRMTMPTPEPSSYVYPSAAEGTPPIVPGWPEVFTGWAFVFNFPDRCSDPCGGDDLGDTPAQGGVANFDGDVVWEDAIDFSGKLTRGMELGNPPGLPRVKFVNPKGAEIHMAIAPHGAPIRESIGVQTTTPVGSPLCACWWVATVLAGGSR